MCVCLSLSLSIHPSLSLYMYIYIYIYIFIGFGNGSLPLAPTVHCLWLRRRFIFVPSNLRGGANIFTALKHQTC